MVFQFYNLTVLFFLLKAKAMNVKIVIKAAAVKIASQSGALPTKFSGASIVYEPIKKNSRTYIKSGCLPHQASGANLDE